MWGCQASTCTETLPSDAKTQRSATRKWLETVQAWRPRVEASLVKMVKRKHLNWLGFAEDCRRSGNNNPENFFFFTHHFSTSLFLFSPDFYSWVLLLRGAGRELHRRLFMQLWLFLKLPLIHILHKGGPFLPNLRGKGCRRADAYICGACAVRCPVALQHTTREAHCFCQMCD